MKIKKIKAVYFSPAGSTERVVREIAFELSEKLKAGVEEIDFTLPESRTETPYLFADNELVVFGVPTYAGRVPNKILPFIKTGFRGNGSPTVSVVTFGNRDYDSSLTELTEELIACGFSVFGASAVACRHVFTDKVGYGRPDCEDFRGISRFTEYITGKILEVVTPDELTMPLIRNGEAVKPYYVPLKEDGEPANFLKVKPETDEDRCSGCGTCAKVCPMGSINPENTSEVTGVCMKCRACVLKCPASAKYFSDEDLISHVKMIENNFAKRADNEFFA